MKDQSKIIAALLVGAAAGAALGLLLAPNTGEGLRGDIAEYVNDLISSAKDKAQSTAVDLKEYGNSAIERAKSRMAGGVDTVKDYGSEGINEAKSKVKTATDDLNTSIQNS